MLLDDFNYHLPPDQIAQQPPPCRSAGRLMVLDRTGNAPPRDCRFTRLPALLQPGDLLVVNRSRVVPARLTLRRASGGSVEALVVRVAGARSMDAWMRPMRRLRNGELLAGAEGLSLRFERAVDGRTGRLSIAEPDGSVLDVLERYGHVPLHPYIHRPDGVADRERYQTVFALEPGSAAAPTAGLHFDRDVLDALARSGVEVASVVLHVGPGTFAPLEHQDVEDNSLHEEVFAISADVIAACARVRARAGRVVAVGTTATRVLETAARRGWLDAEPRDHEGETDLFIRPGYRFRAIDGLLTNFHLPRSSLLMLVCAFAGRERVLAAYRGAVERGFRFFSYGDAMLIMPQS